ncbi:hypothetical protein CGMCC3_g14154 [Colletotrichum fructicola]|uniref:Matrix metalloproteinase-11 n=1 Tax=Colletotrichum fructicola (strain Nara gc5) TaxID=1213859 RepID=L2FP29_COLFN|nr:uncharacterized protein CGMCC3_g14154 [Colletotrichum fructicola]KAE9569732.1 hypothetical protein CGMCC3_g14154 [Colletotrichum fructicola]KAF4429492.1 hypothetical protein CFRS1_v014463 [Colletotrichum fructicola]KAF4491199.1 hypothetical protein CGGC5_v001861 [Colletotrichum fructicola Nara gc5]KAF4882613.1 hypothetical protein CGCFRS4_v014396 [Colletotrichum fructicola]
MGDSGEGPKRHCITQRGTASTYGFPPASHNDSPFDAIQVGLDSIIPRWKASTALKWFLKSEGFPSADGAKLAAETMNQAAQDWNDLSFGVSISQTTDEAAANFNLVYQDNPPDEPGLLASAFFPLQADMDVVIYGTGLKNSENYPLKSTLLHELGHVFGLRHEFADEDSRGQIQFMEANKDSVMSYNGVVIIEETDKHGIREFYKLANGLRIDRSPVTDYEPQLRLNNQRNH